MEKHLFLIGKIDEEKIKEIQKIIDSEKEVIMSVDDFEETNIGKLKSTLGSLDFNKSLIKIDNVVKKLIYDYQEEFENEFPNMPEFYSFKVDYEYESGEIIYELTDLVVYDKDKKRMESKKDYYWEMFREAEGLLNFEPELEAVYQELEFDSEEPRKIK